MNRPASEHDAALEAALDEFLAGVAPHQAERLLADLPKAEELRGLGAGTVLGDFELVRRLGSGGMGVVFEARQVSVPGKRVAVKVLPAVLASDSVVERFRREVVTIGRLDHPAIVPVLTAGIEGETVFYAMKFVEGIPASKLIGELRRRSRLPREASEVRRYVAADPLPEDASSSQVASWQGSYARWVARLGLGVAEALQHAHESGVVHRDVKPGNILITPAGQPILVDFGLALNADDVSLTVTGNFVGTLAYASPEQVRGEELDTRSDVFSLGATLYELLTLNKPFDAENPSQLRQRIEEADPAPLGARVPGDLATICRCALAQAPRHRYATPGAMAHDLRQFLEGAPIVARPPGAWARGWRQIRRYPRTAAAALLVLAVAAGVRVRDHVHAYDAYSEGARALEEMLAGRVELEQLYVEWQALFDSPQAWPPPPYSAVEGLREELETSRSRVLAAAAAANRALRAAFDHVAAYGPARRALVRLTAARLALALRECADAIDPERLRAIERNLIRFGGRTAHAALLDGRGDFRLESRPSGAEVEVRRDPAEGEPLAVGRTPLTLDGLEEGSYVAVFRAPERATTRLPFLVRRAAAFDVEAARPPPHATVHLLESAAVPEGFVHVPAGWTLTRDDPPRWEHVPAFLIQRNEVTNVQLLGWMNAARDRARYANLADPADLEGKPRFANDVGTVHVRLDADGIWRARDLVAPDWPVRGLPRTELEGYAQLATALLDLPREWYASLPRAAEWIRAARGADGRPYPWGWSFSWDRCGGFRSRGSDDYEPRPYRIGQFPADVSPCGVHDMAGSIAEVTLDTSGPVRGIWALCGGSYRSTDANEMRTTSIRGVRNTPREDVGFRLVARPLPSWMIGPSGPPAAFHDDFEREDSDEVGGGWVELAGHPL